MTLKELQDLEIEALILLSHQDGLVRRVAIKTRKLTLFVIASSIIGKPIVLTLDE